MDDERHRFALVYAWLGLWNRLAETCLQASDQLIRGLDDFLGGLPRETMDAEEQLSIFDKCDLVVGHVSCSCWAFVKYFLTLG